MFMTHSAPPNGLDPGDAMPSGDPNADLFGDWCWKPDRYPTDLGKVYTPEQVAAIYPDGFVPNQPSIHHAAVFGADYEGNAVQPPRIGPRV